MFGSASLLYIDIEAFGEKWHWRIKMTSKSSYWRHARESSYIPSCKTTLPSPGRTAILQDRAHQSFLSCFFYLLEGGGGGAGGGRNEECKFRLKNPRVLLALVQTLLTCYMYIPSQIICNVFEVRQQRLNRTKKKKKKTTKKTPQKQTNKQTKTKKNKTKKKKKKTNKQTKKKQNKKNTHTQKTTTSKQEQQQQQQQKKNKQKKNKQLTQKSSFMLVVTFINSLPWTMTSILSCH